MVLIILASLPVVVFVGSIALVWLGTSRARASAEEARAGVRIGHSLSEAIVASSERVGTSRFLPCHETLCVAPKETVLARRTSASFSVLTADGRYADLETADDWRRHLEHLDQIECTRLQIVFCAARPWMSFGVELDGSKRVSHIGPLTVGAD